jgi:hypothetical protein
MTDNWTWILEHLRAIEYTCEKLAHQKIDPEDFRQELLADVADRWKAYDQEKGTPATWIFWRGRAVRSRMLHHAGKRTKETIMLTELAATDHSLDDVVLYQQLYEIAPPLGQVAMRATVEGWRGEELKQRGLTPAKVRRGLKQIREAVCHSSRNQNNFLFSAEQELLRL